ncbi:hypothetical protein R6Q57_023229 [Mikania cordata]
MGSCTQTTVNKVTRRRVIKKSRRLQTLNGKPKRIGGGDEVPSHCTDEHVNAPMLITVEFLSTFRYRAHQAAVRVDEDAELPPDIEFSLCGQHFEMSIERFVVYLGIYYEPETVTDGFAQG